MEVTSIIWLVLTIVFIVVEAFSTALLSIWFAVGAIAALLLSAFVPSVTAQIILFIVVSCIAVLMTRPLAKKYLAKKVPATNVDRNIGRQATVIVAINPSEKGRVRLDGVDWTAQSTVVLQIGASCIVNEIEGNVLTVSPA